MQKTISGRCIRKDCIWHNADDFDTVISTLVVLYFERAECAISPEV